MIRHSQDVKQIHDVILTLTDQHAYGTLQKFILNSFSNIQTIFFENKEEPIIDALSAQVKYKSHTQLCFLFFSLLNVDMILKHQMYELEHDVNHYKLTRFFQDLQSLFVSNFINSHTSLDLFVQQCRDLYIIC